MNETELQGTNERQDIAYGINTIKNNWGFLAMCVYSHTKKIFPQTENEVPDCEHRHDGETRVYNSFRV
jgi:hypothetical protein